MSQQTFITEAAAEQAGSSSLRPKRAALDHVRSFVIRKPLGAGGALVAVVLVLVAIFAPVISNHDPYEVNPKIRFNAPSAETYFGGDHLGRDVFSRVVYGARISLYVGLLSSFIGSTIGMLVGVASVHYGGLTDMTIQRVVDGMMAFPALLLAIAIMAALGTSVNNVVIALSIIYIPSTARILRAQSLAIKEMDYILAARAVGVG